MKQDIKCETQHVDDAEIVLVAFGVSARVCKSAMQLARKRE